MRLKPISALRVGFGLLETFIVIAIIGFFVAVTLPFVQRMREADLRAKSTNNLKNIGLAMHAYHDTNKFLPYCSTTQLTANTSTGGSAHFQMLPFLDQQASYMAGSSTKAIPEYMCPGRSRATDICWTDYFYNLYLNDNDSKLRATNSKRTLISISDGSSNTIGFGHGTIATANWKADADFKGSGSIFTTPSAAGFETFRGGEAGMPERDGEKGESVTSWGGPFSHGALMGLCDATVRMFPYATLPLAFNTYLTPSAGDVPLAP